MKRQLVKVMFGAALAFLVGGPAALAALKVVNIDLGLHGEHPQGAVSVGYVGVAAAPDAGTVWNNIEVLDNNAFQGPPGEFGFWNASVSQANLLDSQGLATSIGVDVIGTNDTGTFGVLEGSTNLGAVATDAVNLMRDYLIGFGGPQRVTLNGFAPGTSVDLYLYGAGDTNNRDTAFSVTDINGLHTATTTGTITGDGNFPVAHTLTLDGDYVILQDVIASVSGAIDIFYDNGAGSGEAPFNGLQAVYTAVPEPASIMLVGLVLVPLLFRKQK